MRRLLIVATLSLSAAVDGGLASEPSKEAERQEMFKKYLDFGAYVKDGRVEPHWMPDGNNFWYVEGPPDNAVFWKVDLDGEKDQLFETDRLRNALKNTLGHTPPGNGVPFSFFRFENDREDAATFELDGTFFTLDLRDYTIRKTALDPVFVMHRDRSPSPDHKWYVELLDGRLLLGKSGNSSKADVTGQRREDFEWRRPVVWSPDASRFAVAGRYHTNRPQTPIIDYINSPENVDWVSYQRPLTGPLKPMELFVFDVNSETPETPVKVEFPVDPNQQWFDRIAWRPNGSELLFIDAGPYFRRSRLISADPTTGTTREILSEDHDTYIETPMVTFVGDDKFIWKSRRNGWAHFYLYDISGKLIRPLTQGDFPVEKLIAVDESGGWIYFLAHVDRTRPYDMHVCRVGIDGEEFTQLTEATGQHYSQFFSPSHDYFVDIHSSMTRPPTVELRRSDGRFIRKISTASVDEEELRWRPPEEFIVKAADGKTDLYGVLYKPYDFDETKKYPVIEWIYGSSPKVPYEFMGHARMPGLALAQLGFVVMKVDARGPGDCVRGKEFEKKIYGTFGRHEIPEHKHVLNELAKKRPYMDLNRVGVYGASQGGYFAVRGMLQAPETYHVGVAVAPVIDVATHANFYFLGPPDKNAAEYEFSSNLRLAHKLEGKLLLIHGTSDWAVPIAHTMKMVNALVEADKQFDMLVLPGWGHWTGNRRMQRHWTDAMARYFVEHLNP